MKFLIIGSCRNNDYEFRDNHYMRLAQEAGQELASRDHSIITGGAGGLQGILVGTYKRCNGPEWTAYFAEGEEEDPNAWPIP